MIIADGIHLTSTTGEEELHEFAQKIGLKRKWYQPQNGHPHYDLTTVGMVTKAVQAGAVRTSSKTLVLSAWRMCADKSHTIANLNPEAKAELKALLDELESLSESESVTEMFTKLWKAQDKRKELGI